MLCRLLAVGQGVGETLDILVGERGHAGNANTSAHKMRFRFSLANQGDAVFKVCWRFGKMPP